MSASGLSQLWDFSALVPSTFGVPNPSGAIFRVEAKDIDTIVLPMLGFTGPGSGSGTGAGYYNGSSRRISGASKKIGIAFACQELRPPLR